jgi:serine/threonine-protein kinase
VAAGVALAVVGAGAVLLVRHGAAGPAAAPPEVASTPPSAAAPPAPTAVTLTVRAKPAEVRVYLDGVLLSTGPYQGKVAASTAPHTVRVEAEHYVAKEEQVTLGSDVMLSFDLLKEAAPESSSAKGASRPPRGGGPAVKPKFGIEADSPYKR